MADTKKLNLAQKLIEVRKTIKKVKKDTKGYGYNYVSGSQALGIIREEMDNQGVLLEPHILYPEIKLETYIKVDAKGQKKDIREYLITSQMKMIWVNADNPEDTREVNWYMAGEQSDPSQAFGSGLTYSERYFILKYFNVPTDKDDPDGNKGNGEETDPFAGDQTDDGGKDEKLVTKKQLNRYFAMAKEAGVNIDELDGQIKKKYKVGSKSEMTMAQLDEVFKYLEDEIKKNSQ